MAKQTINIGTSPNDGTGDALRTAMSKVNTNFDEVYTLLTGNETLITINGATGVVQHELSTTKLFYHTGIVSDFTVNLTSLVMNANEVVNVVLVLNQGASPYIPTSLRIANTPQTINWRGSAQPLGTANKKDVVSFSIIRPSVGYVVLATLTTFGTAV